MPLAAQVLCEMQDAVAGKTVCCIGWTHDGLLEGKIRMRHKTRTECGLAEVMKNGDANPWFV